MYARTKRDVYGFFCNRAEAKVYLELARAFTARVVDRMLADGNTDVQDILNSLLPGDEALPYFAAEMGGTISVLSDLNYNPTTGTVVPQFYGDGPLVLELHHLMINGGRTGHYTIHQAYSKHNDGMPQSFEDAEMAPDWGKPPDQDSGSECEVAYF
jgi:hypothetical protein